MSYLLEHKRLSGAVSGSGAYILVYLLPFIFFPKRLYLAGIFNLLLMSNVVNVFIPYIYFFNQCVLLVMIYRSEIWTLRAQLVHKFKVAQQAME
jgi:hypothetical protein